MKRVLYVILAVIVFSFLVFDSLSGEKITYPETKKIKVVEKMHGIEIIDNYRWLEKVKDPQVQTWLTGQNKFSRKILESLPQRPWLIDRFTYFARYHTRLITREEVVGERSFLLSKRKIGGKDNWVILTRAKKDAPERVLVNLSQYSPHINAELTLILPSPDGKYLLFSIEGGGRENTSARVLEVDTTKIVLAELRGWRHSHIFWLPDSSGFYYTASPRKGEVPAGEEYSWASVYFHKMGTTAAADKKVFSHPGEKNSFHSAKLTKSKRYILFNRLSFLRKCNEVYFKKVGSQEPPEPIAAGLDASFQVYEFGDKFLLLTSLNAPLSRVLITPIDKPGRENWKEFIPEAKDKINSIVLSGDYIFAKYSSNAATRIKMFDKSGNYLRDIPLPYIGGGTARVKEKEPGIKVTFFSYTYPPSEFNYDIKTNKLNFCKQNFPLKVDASPYITRQVWFRSKDGTKVSMFLLQRKDIKQNSLNPTLLHGYGGFGRSMVPWFNTDFIIWLEAGGMVAIPNLRGGGEYGKKWYDAGRGINKQNTFDDCIAAAEWLIQNKYTNPGKLALYGSSNGGLLVGAVAVQRPDLFKAVWSSVPILDMMRFHKFGPARVWIKEYGDPDDPAEFKHVLHYSPYHNVKDRTHYPAMLITAGENDPRCSPFHAMKMAARLQQASSSDNPILLQVHKHTGHGTGVVIDKKEVIKKAEGWAFLMFHLGMSTPSM